MIKCVLSEHHYHEAVTELCNDAEDSLSLGNALNESIGSQGINRWWLYKLPLVSGVVLEPSKPRSLHTAQTRVQNPKRISK